MTGDLMATADAAEITRLRGLVASLSARNETLAVAVSAARDTFASYGEMHRAKASADGDAKARRNEQLAAQMAAALASDNLAMLS